MLLLSAVSCVVASGLQNCRHFVRGADQCQTSYHEDPISGRLSITMPVGSLQQSECSQCFAQLHVLVCRCLLRLASAQNVTLTHRFKTM